MARQRANPEKQSARMRDYYLKNKSTRDERTPVEKVQRAIQAKRNREAKLEQYKAVNQAWHEANRVRARVLTSAWRKKNLPYGAAQQTAREAAKIHATPRWANLEEIKDVYVEARYHGLQVDHIVPLRSKLVCGYT